MILLADSGSTKTNWVLLNDDGNTTEATTQGFNPYFQTSRIIEEAIRCELSKEILAHGEKELTIYYYGAGCSSPEKIKTVKTALENNFIHAKVFVEHDLLASARALCGHKPGIACILGTGSNSCYYDGKEIIENVPSVGYFFGDYGSAGHIGKKLIQAYFDDQLPDDLKKTFSEMHDFDREYILENVYQKPLPNRFLASYGKIASEFIVHPYIRQLVKNCFTEFLIRQVTRYSHHRELPINFVGSVALSNKELLLEVLEERKLKPGIILRSPMSGLLSYHASERKTKSN
jgi:N-acetylglucosamine kinase-like BadF-type ATPase